jgi:hypothetical protein
VDLIFDRMAAGQDFGLNITFVKIGWLGDVVYVIGDYGAFNMTSQSFNEELAALFNASGVGLANLGLPA